MDCAKILEHFPSPHSELWARIEAKKEKRMHQQELREQGQLTIIQPQFSEATDSFEHSSSPFIVGQPAQKRRATPSANKMLAATNAASPMRSVGLVTLALGTCLVTFLVVILSRSAGVSWESELHCPAGFWLPIDSESRSQGRSSCRRCSVCEDELFAQCQPTANTECVGWSRLYPSDRHFISPASHNGASGSSFGIENAVSVPHGGSSATSHVDKLTWHQPNACPSQRADAALWSSTATQTIYLFGGRSEEGNEGDTWRLLPDTDRWQRIVVKQEPAARSGAMVWHEQDSDRILLFGGQDRGAVGFDDLWLFDNQLATWAHIGGRASPPRSTILLTELFTRNIFSQRDFFESSIERRWPPGRCDIANN
eukprot:SAG31_NODE_4866_length_2899_cov_2.048929_2_plen_369_part_00